MHRLRRTWRARTMLLAALLAATAWTTPALARNVDGPEFGNNRYTSTIRAIAGELDQDIFVGRVMAGERISVSVGATRRSSLLPTVVLVGPDGVDRVTGTIRKRGRLSVIRRFEADATGTWTVVVAGDGLAEGDYQAVFQIAPRRPTKLRKQTLGGGGLTRDHVFGGIEGALLDVTVTSARRGEVAAPVALTDPDDAPVALTSGSSEDAIGSVHVKRTRATLKGADGKGLPLSEGDGDYTLRVGIDEGEATYGLVLRLRPPVDRIRSRKPVDLSQAQDPFLTPVEESIPVWGGETITIGGRNFPGNVPPDVYLGGVLAEDVVVAGNLASLTCTVPPGIDGARADLKVVNPDDQVAVHDDYIVYVQPPAVTDIAVSSGVTGAPDQVPLDGGGAEIVVTGERLDRVVSVTFGGTAVTTTNATATSFRFEPGARPAGSPELVVTDALGRQIQFVGNVSYAGFVDRTAARSPIGTDEDDLTALRGAIGDLDGDGRSDDLLIGSYNSVSPAYDGSLPDGNRPGTRQTFTRFLTYVNGSPFADRTAIRFPLFGGELPDNAGIGDWNARGVAIGDLDGNPGVEIVIAGGAPVGEVGEDFPRLRVFDNIGTGVFHVNTDDLPDSRYDPELRAITEEVLSTEDGPVPVYVTIHGARKPPATASAVALGDLDGDGDLDVVLGLPDSHSRAVEASMSGVDMTQSPPYINSADVVPIGTTYYYGGTRVIMNDMPRGNGLTDETEARVQSVGDSSKPSQYATFRARDIALGDIDGDMDIDIVVTWNNPNSMTREGSERYPALYFGSDYVYFNGPGADPRTATRILVNNGTANFDDHTYVWLPDPDPDAPEFWHGNRVLLADLDLDDDLDLLILHRRDLSRFKGVAETFDRHSLRILRNDGLQPTADPGFVDVTESALPAIDPVIKDNLRGNALAVADVNGDGWPDILVGTQETLPNGAPSTRLLLGSEGLVFTLRNEFLPGALVDSGEVNDLLLADVDGDGALNLILLSEIAPATSTGGESLRFFDWQR